jgi:hypothetical protein
MVRGRGNFDTSDLVVWMSTMLLAMLCGLGLGFVVWSIVSAVGKPNLWGLGTYAVAVAGVLLASRLRGAYLRLALALCAATLALSFAFGDVLFAPLALSH